MAVLLGMLMVTFQKQTIDDNSKQRVIWIALG